MPKQTIYKQYFSYEILCVHKEKNLKMVSQLYKMEMALCSFFSRPNIDLDAHTEIVRALVALFAILASWVLIQWCCITWIWGGLFQLNYVLPLTWQQSGHISGYTEEKLVSGTISNMILAGPAVFLVKCALVRCHCRAISLHYFLDKRHKNPPTCKNILHKKEWLNRLIEVDQTHAIFIHLV